ncbi:hypothetical protein V1264_006061 [Littorina saxatilis]|uniref:Integrase catalytic domain-containing protein n=1 Tax=Littorina saxatilis TaxID=31220 RepID=A0AAN9AX03_9CAEN
MEHAPKMDWTTDNPAESFKLFSQRIELYFKAKKVPTAEQTTHILLQVGEEGLRRYNSWTLTDDDEQTPAAILKRFREQLEPSENFRVARLKLMAFRQGPSESLDNFVNKCKLQAIKCDFSTEETNERIIELIIANTTDADYQKNLLSQKKGLKLENAVQIGRTFEATACHVQQLQDMRLPSTHVHSLQTSRCKNCGRSHEPRKCPAYGSQCRSCGKENHWAKVCRSSATGSNQKQQSQRNQNTRGDQRRGAHHDSRRAVHDVQASTDVEDHFDMLSFNNVKISSITRRDEAFVQLNVKLTSRPGIHNLNLKVDTGAQGNTLPLRTFRQMFPDHLREDEMPTSEIADKAKSVRLTAYNGTTIPCHGIFSFPCKFRDSSWKEAQFHIVDVTGPAVMGLPTCEQLKIVTLHCSIDTERSEPISSTKDLMRRYPQQFNKDIEQRTKSCPICQEHKPSQSPESLMPHEVPSRPWETLGTDLFRLHGYEYLLLTDYYSKYFIVRKLAGDATSNTVIRALKQMFSEHGIPSKLISDNGPQFSSDAFVTFAREWAFDHITSSPRYPRSNGISVRHVQTVKDALQKASKARTDPDLALLCLRTTPLSSSILSPLEILTGRKARSNMPIKLNSLPNAIRKELQYRQKVQKIYHDPSAWSTSPCAGLPGREMDPSYRHRTEGGAEVVPVCHATRTDAQEEQSPHQRRSPSSRGYTQTTTTRTSTTAASFTSGSYNNPIRPNRQSPAEIRPVDSPFLFAETDIHRTVVVKNSNI